MRRCRDEPRHGIGGRLRYVRPCQGIVEMDVGKQHLGLAAVARRFLQIPWPGDREKIWDERTCALFPYLSGCYIRYWKFVGYVGHS